MKAKAGCRLDSPIPPSPSFCLNTTSALVLTAIRTRGRATIDKSWKCAPPSIWNDPVFYEPKTIPLYRYPPKQRAYSQKVYKSFLIAFRWLKRDHAIWIRHERCCASHASLAPARPLHTTLLWRMLLPTNYYYYLSLVLREMFADRAICTISCVCVCIWQAHLSSVTLWNR